MRKFVKSFSFLATVALASTGSANGTDGLPYWQGGQGIQCYPGDASTDLGSVIFQTQLLYVPGVPGPVENWTAVFQIDPVRQPPRSHHPSIHLKARLPGRPHGYAGEIRFAAHSRRNPADNVRVFYRLYSQPKDASFEINLAPRPNLPNGYHRSGRFESGGGGWFCLHPYGGVAGAGGPTPTVILDDVEVTECVGVGCA